MEKSNIAICCVAYNRPDSLKNLLDSLSEASYPHDVTLIISIDYSGNDIVEKFANNYRWSYGEKRIISHKSNLGLRKHILSCGELLNEYDAIIVLEDDVVVAPSFFYFAEQCVEKYKDNEDIAGISLFTFPLNHFTKYPFHPIKTSSDIFLLKVAQSWGQVWMRRSWREFMKWYENNNDEFGIEPHLPENISLWPKSSWQKYHIRYCIEANKYFVYPYYSLSTDNAVPGVHFTKESTFEQAFLFYGIKKEFALNPSVKYDGFFENEDIPNWLGINQDEICVDFYGGKKNKQSKRYWLTREIAPYRIVRSFALQMKPFEWNILKNIKGDDLFLYDTSISEKCRREDRVFDFARYIFPLTNARIVVLSALKYQLLKLMRIKK